MECLKCKDSNSQQKTMIKMDNNCFKIVDYNESTIIFNASEIKSGSQFATCSDFGKILNYSEYECINDSSVIELTEINESTIIIKNSNEICSNNFDEWNRNKANGTENGNIQIEVMESNTNFIINNTYMNETKFIDELVEIQKSITYYPINNIYTNKLEINENNTENNESIINYIINGEYTSWTKFKESSNEVKESDTIYIINNKTMIETEYKEENNNISETIINSEKNSFIPSYKNECEFGEFDNKKIINDLKDIIKKDIISYISSCQILNGSNFVAAIVPSNNNDPEKQIEKGISSFDLGNCTNVLKEHYNIPYEENLIILNIETKNDENDNNEDNSIKLGKNTKLEIYDYSGRELNISICQDDIKIMKYIGDIKEIDLDTAKTLSDRGIDVFNAADKFFNDICHPYDNPFGKDIILNDRRNDMH